MRKYWEAIKKDFWVVLLDIVAVNISYLGALLLRFFDNTTYGTLTAEQTTIYGIIINQIVQENTAFSPIVDWLLGIRQAFGKDQNMNGTVQMPNLVMALS